MVMSVLVFLWDQITSAWIAAQQLHNLCSDHIAARLTSYTERDLINTETGNSQKGRM
jgi:hypothetical protein